MLKTQCLQPKTTIFMYNDMTGHLLKLFWSEPKETNTYQMHDIWALSWWNRQIAHTLHCQCLWENITLGWGKQGRIWAAKTIEIHLANRPLGETARFCFELLSYYFWILCRQISQRFHLAFTKPLIGFPSGTSRTQLWQGPDKALALDESKK